MFTSHIARAWIVGVVMLGGLWIVPGNVAAADAASFEMPQRLTAYFEEMSAAKPLVVRTGKPWETHRNALRPFLLECVGLQPLPERVPLDVRMSEPVDHPWCTVRRVSYQLWPGVYSTGLLFMPKQFQERPAPAVLCPHGHWATGNAHPAVQARCLNLARLGYVTFSSTQNHFEDLYVGVSHQTLMVWNNMRALDLLETLQLYAAHGCADRVECRYFDTGHDYDRPKREYTYWWLDHWLRGSTVADPAAEPETATLPVDALEQLTVEQPKDRGFGEISRLFRTARTEPTPKWTSLGDWETHRTRQADILRGLLGMHTALPRRGELLSAETQRQDGLTVQHVAFPSEGSLVVPTWVIRPEQITVARLPVEIILDARGKDALLEQTGDDSPRMRAHGGSLVVLPDLRTFGESFSTGTDNAAAQTTAWQRNGIVWGRPVVGMAVTDLQAVIDAVAARPDADMQRLQIVARGSGDLAIAGLFAMVLDPRIAESDLDFANACYENRNLMLVPRVLLYGDIPHWASLVADRRLTLRRVPSEAGDLHRVDIAP